MATDTLDRDPWISYAQMKRVCPPCAAKMLARNLSRVRFSAVRAYAAKDPAAVCGSLWFHGTDANRAAFGKGSEGRGRDEKAPKAWFDACVAKVSATEGAGTRRYGEGVEIVKDSLGHDQVYVNGERKGWFARNSDGSWSYFPRSLRGGAFASSRKDAIDKLVAFAESCPGLRADRKPGVGRYGVGSMLARAVTGGYRPGDHVTLDDGRVGVVVRRVGGGLDPAYEVDLGVVVEVVPASAMLFEFGERARRYVAVGDRVFVPLGTAAGDPGTVEEVRLDGSVVIRRDVGGTVEIAPGDAGSIRPAAYDEARDWIGDKIKKLVGEGKDQKQAVAIALSMARKKFPGKVAEKDVERTEAKPMQRFGEMWAEVEARGRARRYSVGDVWVFDRDGYQIFVGDYVYVADFGNATVTEIINELSTPEIRVAWDGGRNPVGIGTIVLPRRVRVLNREEHAHLRTEGNKPTRYGAAVLRRHLQVALDEKDEAGRRVRIEGALRELDDLEAKGKIAATDRAERRRYFDPLTVAGILAGVVMTSPIWTGLLRRAGDVAGAIRLALMEDFIDPREAEELHRRAEDWGLLSGALSRPSMAG